MYVYFNREGILTTSIPHGEPVRQGSYLNIYVCLDEDFGQDYKVNVELIFPNGTKGTTMAIAANEEGATIETFEKTRDSEVTYDLIPGNRYLTYHFKFAPESSTIYAGKLVANISLVNVVEAEQEGQYFGDAILNDVKYCGNIDIFVEKTFGTAKRTIPDNSTNYYSGLVTQINKIDNNVKNIRTAVTSNRVGILKVSEYDEEDGVISLEYDDEIVEDLSYDVEEGILTIKY